MADKSNDLDAGRAFAEHGGQVYRYLLRRTGDPHDAEELTQQVFVAAATLSSGRRPESLLSWLYAVAERRFVDEARRRARAANFVRQEARFIEPVEPAYGPAVARALRRAIGRLPAEQRQVVVMKVLEGRSFAEIAVAVGAGEGACKMRFSRGIERVQESLRREGITR